MERIRQYFHDLIFWICQSHRWSHFVGGLVLGLVFGFGAAVVVAAAMEWKDCQHDRLNAPYGLDCRKWTWRCWDWWDFGLTVAGGLLGSAIRWLVVGRFL